MLGGWRSLINPFRPTVISLVGTVTLQTDPPLRRSGGATLVTWET